MGNGGRPPGYAKTGGRQPGTPNKTRLYAKQIIEANSDLDPLVVMCHIMNNNEKALGYTGPQIKVLKDGGVVELPWFTPELRYDAAKNLARKIYPDPSTRYKGS